jgi:VIT1/CCC1 family predicted Fe2+/Mn2+ transporter
MGIFDEGGALSLEEQRLLAGLEDRTGRDDPKFQTALTAGSRRTRLHSRRARDMAAVLLLLVGAALMIATFAIWPLVGAVAIVIQAIALSLVVSRWGPVVAASVRRWSNHHLQLADPGSRPARR